ncbi:helix-turn-helix domain-containing protein [Salinispora vitiensis]|uniref:helix-turn-helix domain-containing protein n=1 Tax=Salinispora vitiensis TaxID=999544 RepID=UPI0009B75F13|nr:helix-turn-helix transcriptional regulator [Salinispora vitiensis]
MGNELFGLLGLDSDNPHIRAALEDARDVERLIDTLVGLRVGQGLTQADVASEMETTQSAVSKFERAGGDPRISTVQRYARASGGRVRLIVEVSGLAASWKASYHIPASVDSESDEMETPAEFHPVIKLAS